METPKKTKLIVIVGPTGSGKTSLSLLLAKEFNGEVISADSRQIYKKLDVGTEKITLEEMHGIPHHLIDLCDIDTIYTAFDFKKDAEEAISLIIENGHTPIIAGGTFFYIDTLLGTMSSAPVAPNRTLREELEKKTTEELFAELQTQDPTRASNIDQHNRRRLIRALEIVAAITTVPHTMTEADCPYNVLKIGISVDKDVLRTRLRARAQGALERGLIEETQRLLAEGISKERLSEIGHEYRIVMEYLNGDFDKNVMLQKFEEKNWQYAKRQLMWLKRDTAIRWIAREDEEVIIEAVSTFLEN
jgi:tRNA dimethylallyltransferase